MRRLRVQVVIINVVFAFVRILVLALGRLNRFWGFEWRILLRIYGHIVRRFLLWRWIIRTDLSRGLEAGLAHGVAPMGWDLHY